MKLCKRNVNDPLLRAFIDQYSLHLLPIPREMVHLGDIFITDGRTVSTPGSIKYLVNPPVEIKALQKKESMASISGTYSNKLDLNVGMNLLDNFLGAMGAPEISGTVKAELDQKKASSLRFAFNEPLRDSMDVVDFGFNLMNSSLIEDHPVFDKDYVYYITTATVRTNSITVVMESGKSAAFFSDISAMNAAAIKKKVSVSKSSENSITFQGKKSLVFGVELHELKVDKKTKMIRLPLAKGSIKGRQKAELNKLTQPVMIGGATGEAFLDI